MVESQVKAMKPEMYERLIDRLGLALDVARTAVRLRDEVPAELELRGLSRAEMELINAYLKSYPVGGQGGSVGLAPAESNRSANVVWLKDKTLEKGMTRSRSRQVK
jgi:hypothetical protein